MYSKPPSIPTDKHKVANPDTHNPETLEEIRKIFENQIPAKPPVSKRKLNKRQHSEALDDCAKKIAKYRKLEHTQTTDDIF